MKNTVNPDKRPTISSCLLRRNFEAVHFSDKLKPYQNGRFKICKNPTDVTYELIIEYGRFSHTNRSPLNPHYPQDSSLFLS